MDPAAMAERLEKIYLDRGYPDVTAHDRARQIVREFLASKKAEMPIEELGIILFDKNKAMREE